MTTMTETQVAQIYQVFIRATPEQVWEAMTNPEFTQKYFYGGRVESTLEPGASIKYGMGENIGVDGEVIESDPPRKLVHTWRSLYDEALAVEPASRVTWELELTDVDVTKLTVIHDQLDGAPQTAADVAGGWMFVLSGLKTLVETGEPLS